MNHHHMNHHHMNKNVKPTTHVPPYSPHVPPPHAPHYISCLYHTTCITCTSPLTTSTAPHASHHISVSVKHTRVRTHSHTLTHSLTHSLTRSHTHTPLLQVDLDLARKCLFKLGLDTFTHLYMTAVLGLSHTHTHNVLAHSRMPSPSQPHVLALPPVDTCPHPLLDRMPSTFPGSHALALLSTA